MFDMREQNNCNNARKDKNKDRQDFQKAAENRTLAAMVDIASAESTLDDYLVHTPVEYSDKEVSEQKSCYGIVGMIDGLYHRQKPSGAEAVSCDHPPARERPSTVNRAAPNMRITVCKTSV